MGLFLFHILDAFIDACVILGVLLLEVIDFVSFWHIFLYKYVCLSDRRMNVSYFVELCPGITLQN